MDLISRTDLLTYLESNQVTIKDCFNALNCYFCKYTFKYEKNENVANEKMTKHLVRCQGFFSFMQKNKNLRRHLGLAFWLDDTDQIVYTINPPAHILVGDDSSLTLTSDDIPGALDIQISKLTLTNLTCFEKITSVDATLEESSSPKASTSQSATSSRAKLSSLISTVSNTFKRVRSRSQQKSVKSARPIDPTSFEAIANAVAADNNVPLSQSKRNFSFINNKTTNVLIISADKLHRVS